MLKIAQIDVKNNTGTYVCMYYTLYTCQGFIQDILLGGEKKFCTWYWMCAEHAALGGGGPTVSQHVCLLRIKLISPYMYAVLCVTAIISPPLLYEILNAHIHTVTHKYGHTC